MAKPKPIKLKVTSRALIQRINRKLKPDNEKLCMARTVQTQMDVGKYYVIGGQHRGVTRVRVDLEALGRELGALADHEEMAE